MTLAYLDASAFVKTIVEEPESRRLTSWLTDSAELASSTLLRVESLRAVARHGGEATDRARRALARLLLVSLDDALLAAAGDLPVDVRSLDAIHLATALTLGRDLRVLVTYDERMARAATELDIEVASP